MLDRPRCSGPRSTAATSARGISAPVASPPACAIRSRWWPPSRVSESSPSWSWSKLAPSAISSRTASGPSVTRSAYGVLVAGAGAGDQGVASCCSGVSPGPSAAAMPPCAQRVEPASRHALVTTRTLSTRRGAAQRGGQPGDAGADDHDVGRVVQPGAGAAGARDPAYGRASRRLAGREVAADQAGSPNVSAGSKPVARILLSASTKTTCGWNSRPRRSPSGRRRSGSPGRRGARGGPRRR